MKTAYATLATHYDLIFQDKDYHYESNFIKRIIKERKPEARSILDVGCGTGTHLNLLKDDFHDLYGVDVNPEMIREAKKKSTMIKYSVGSMADFKLGRKFDVLISLYSVFNYNLSIRDARKSLTNFKKHLNRNGLVVLALYTPSNFEKKVSLHVGKNNGIEAVKINEFSTDKKTRIETSNYFVLLKDKNGINFFTELNHKYRIYAAAEFTSLLKKMKFARIETFDNFMKKKISQKTKYPIFVASPAN